MAYLDQDTIKTALNAAIWTVLTATYKKDHPEAFAIVERAGYGITKYDGCWRIHNAETNRTVYISRRYYGYLIRGTAHTKDVCKKDFDDTRKVDYVGILNKPYNRVWIDLENKRYWHPNTNPTKDKYARIRSEKNSLEINAQEIERTKAQIATMQAHLIWLGEQKARHEINLAQARREYGLKAR